MFERRSDPSLTWHVSTPLLTSVMMFKNARPSITCQPFRYLLFFIEHRRAIQRRMLDWQTISMLPLLRYPRGVIPSLPLLSAYIERYLSTSQIFYQKKGTRWICWHIHYVVVVISYQIIKPNKCPKDVKTTSSALRQGILSSPISRIRAAGDTLIFHSS